MVRGRLIASQDYGNQIVTTLVTDSVITSEFVTIDDTEGRSHTANNYLWLLLQKIAEVLNTSREEIYLVLLERYGVFTYLLAEPDSPQYKELARTYRVVRDRGESPITTKSGKTIMTHTYQCFKGTSGYSQEEMSNFLNGVESECDELEIKYDKQTH